MNQQKYDLEERCFNFAKAVGTFCAQTEKNFVVAEYMKQLVRSSASIGANYIEANEALSKKDFLMRAKIARKEAKETIYWLKLIESQSKVVLLNLIDEADQLKKILSAIIEKSKLT